MTYFEFVKNYMGVDECKNNKKYSNAGHTFCLNQEEMEGIYWFYQSDDFIIDIHDFFIKEEIIQNSVYNMPDYISIYSSYLISCNGEKFNPYETLTANSLYTLDFDNIKDNYRFLLHENSYYLGVAIGFKKDVLEKKLSSLKVKTDDFYHELFLNDKSILTKSLEPIAMDILNCKMNSPAAEIFFEAKANEWISFVIDTFLSKKETKFSTDDRQALENVARYLDDHYALNVSQETLEKISMMSGTKLKKMFKEKYNQSITEYTQRKRMNMAEVLLINTNLPIKEIAKSVGYSSHSKFTTYYKRYKKSSPSDVRKLSQSGKKILECKGCKK